MNNEEIYGIMNDADDVMEAVGADPFGMSTVTEVSNINLNSLTAKDLQDPATMNVIKAKLASIDSVDKVSTVYKKINKLLTVGGVAATAYQAKTGTAAGKDAALLLTLGNIALGSINKLVKKAVDKKEHNELKKVDSLLTTSISDMKKALAKASDDEKQKIQASIDKAEQLKAYIASKQDAQFNRNV